MEFWVLWWIGIGITIVTRIVINMITYCKDNKDSYGFRCSRCQQANCNADICSKSPIVQIIMHILVIICIILVGGIAVGKFLGMFYEGGVISQVLFAIIPAALTYFVGWVVLGLYYFENNRSQICFLVVFVISIVGWTASISKYNQNIEMLQETVIAEKQDRQLLYFCNIPVQEISGTVSGNVALGTGNISGNITTSNELSYWYANQDGEGKYDSAPANSSKIIFLEENEISPYVEIVKYQVQNTKINHNNGKEEMAVNNEWVEYYFYLPKEIMQYSLN